MSLQTTASRLGASSEKLEQCPYDPCHWIRPTKLDDHVVKCRLNHQEDLAEKGERPILLTCQYNYLHKVFLPEWKFHAARCPDRTGELKNIFPEILTISGEDLPPDLGERLEMYGGLNEGKLWCSQLGRYVKWKDIGKDANQLAQEAAEEKGRTLAEEVENGWKEKIAQPPPPSFQIKCTQEEIDFWNAPSTSKTPFSWMLHNSNPHGYVTNYPPGLTKKQRREFEIRNSKELEKKIAAKKKAEEEAVQDLEEKPAYTDKLVEEFSVEKGEEEGRTQF